MTQHCIEITEPGSRERQEMDIDKGALLRFKSHIEGRNATVTIYPDRIEWDRHRLFGRADTRTILLRHVTGLDTHKGGLTYTNVTVTAGLTTVTMRVPKALAAKLRATITEHAQPVT